MLRLKSIQLYQFRNYGQSRFDFTERVTAICGNNGSGKTNLLDAVYYLGFARSYFSRPDAQNVQHGQQGLRIEGQFSLQDEPVTLSCILRENNRKEINWNNTAYRKLSDHLGKLPCVMIAPDDIELISGGGEERRAFLDTLLAQLNRDYLLALTDYTKILQQRNGLLKQTPEGALPDSTLLDILDAQLSEKGQFIFEQRNVFLQAFLPLVKELYIRIAGSDDGLNAVYESQLQEDDLLQLLRQNLRKDLLVQRTTRGIHRDDLVFSMGDHLFKSEASQGQRKSLLFACKLAEWQTLKEKKGFTPILLLDDVFEKLDEKRMQQLLHWVCAGSDGQILISDTHPERIEAQLHQTGINYQLIRL
jgi:DNA replication and repair protein RecF